MGFTNRDRLRRRLRAIPVEARKALKAQNAVNAAELVAVQKSFADASFSDPTGQLQSTIKHQDVSDSTRISQKVSAGAPGTPYAAWVEFGTSKNDPRPFFWPAYRLMRRRMKARMGRAAKKAVQEAIK